MLVDGDDAFCVASDDFGILEQVLVGAQVG
jgi:hypothetical protein